MVKAANHRTVPRLPRARNPTVTRPATIRKLVCAAICAAAIPAAAQETGDLDDLQQHAIDLVNESRIEAALSELSLRSVPNEAAQGHSIDMVERNYYAHVSPDGQTPRDRFLEADGNRWALSGENIAKCSGCEPPPDIDRVEAFHQGWMQSPEHRANILSEGFDTFGFGILSATDEIYAVQTFAGPGPDSDAPTSSVAERRSTVLEGMNDHREAAGLEALAPSDALDEVADQVLAARLSDEDLPDNLFCLLPEGSTGWTSLTISTGTRGASGTTLTTEDVTAFVEDWATGNAEEPFGGERATDLGFSAAALDSGRATAVAIFGGRD